MLQCQTSFAIYRIADGIVWEANSVELKCSAISELSVNVLQAILPVKVTSKTSGITVHTYAFYDNGTTGCFISDDLKEN